MKKRPGMGHFLKSTQKVEQNCDEYHFGQNEMR